MPESLRADLESTESFASRHIAPDAAEIAAMLKAAGAPDLETLINNTVPANIRIDPDGEPRVLDFGLAKLSQELAASSAAGDMTLTGQFVGSLPWSSPEQATGRADLAVEPIMNIWDNAPLLPILAEAGGRFTDWTGAPRIDGGDAVSTNGVLHDAVLSLLRAG